MTRENLERLIGRAVLDPDFRERLLADREKAILEEGYELTREELANLKAIDQQKARAMLDRMAAEPESQWK